MTSNVVHLKKPKGFRPAMGLAMGRTAMCLGRKRGDVGLFRAGKERFDQTNAELDDKACRRATRPLLRARRRGQAPIRHPRHRSRQPDRRLRGNIFEGFGDPLGAAKTPPARPTLGPKFSPRKSTAATPPAWRAPPSRADPLTPKIPLERAPQRAI